MQKTLIVPYTEKFTGFEHAGTADISEYVWDNSYCPKAEAKIIYTDEAFYIRLEAEETKELMRMEKNPGITDCACSDSCMEFFIMPSPEDDRRYFNFEFTPKGAVYIGFGLDRYDNRLLKDAVVSQFDIHTNIDIKDDISIWTVETKIPFRFLNDIMCRNISFEKGKAIHANFYKCGDECMMPHYGTWNPVESENPDFHLSEYFGKLYLD